MNTLENLIDAINNLTAALRAQGGAPGAVITQPAQTSTLLAPATPPPANVTADSLVALITPHIGNEAIKAELGTAMRSIGVNSLPEAQPHQFPTLYQLFQGVIARFAGATPPQSTSII